MHSAFRSEFKPIHLLCGYMPDEWVGIPEFQHCICRCIASLQNVTIVIARVLMEQNKIRGRFLGKLKEAYGSDSESFSCLAPSTRFWRDVSKHNKQENMGPFCKGTLRIPLSLIVKVFSEHSSIPEVVYLNCSYHYVYETMRFKTLMSC